MVNNNGTIISLNHAVPFHMLACRWNLSAASPIDSALVSGVEGTDGEKAEPRDEEAGNYLYIKQLLI